MRIATNVPTLFLDESNINVFDLGRGEKNVDLIIICLQKNWGGGYINKINNLRRSICSYHQSTPCYVVGCESTIPDHNIAFYFMPERDEAIRKLCDEVLRRSTSLGVRGMITARYLNETLGYDKQLFDVIYGNEGVDVEKSIAAFIEKNDSRLKRFIGKLAAFQFDPGAYVDITGVNSKEIFIHRPLITIQGELSRLSADIVYDGLTTNLWCETTRDYHQFLLVERSDAFLCVVLPMAMREGKDIICEAPVTEDLLHNLNEVLIPQLCNHDKRLYRTFVKADSTSTRLFCANAVATGMSCGVDSFYTARLYHQYKLPSLKLTHLYVGNYLYGNDSLVFERAELTAKRLGLPLVRSGTNINEALDLPHSFTHFFKIMFGVYALKKLFSVYYYSTAYDFSNFSLKDNSVNDTASIELLLLYTFSTEDLKIMTGGVKSERFEKTRTICNFDVANDFLNVCLYPERQINCGKCVKCKRTLLMIDMIGALDMFRKVFDIDQYRKERLNAFVYLVREKNYVMLRPVYEYFLANEPDTIEQAERQIGQNGHG